MSKQWKHDYDILKTDPPEFRLVTLQPGLKPAYLQLKLVTFVLGASPPYEALSYVWGGYDHDDPDLIMLDGVAFEVTTNLSHALYGLRKAQEERTIWIDAICIDQDDLDERSFQVQLMTDIYKGASGTIVWLGEDSFYTPRLFQLMSTMNSSRTWQSEDEHTINLASQSELRKRLRSSTDLRTTVKKGLYDNIAHQPFLTRIWIVQEVVLSSKVTVTCGEDEMTWEQFSNSIYVLNQAFIRALPEEYVGGAGLPNLETISLLRELTIRNGELSLGDIIASLRRAKSTDINIPRDMVYGLLGLFPKSSIKPDYTRATTKDVYLQLVESCIKEERSLDIITLSRKPVSNIHFPSWIPDWTDVWDGGEDYSYDDVNHPEPEAFPLVLKYGSGDLLKSFTRADNLEVLRGDDGVELKLIAWSAHGATTPIATIDKTRYSLSVSGVSIGVITEVGRYTIRSEAEGSLFFSDAFADWEEVLLQKFGNCRDPGHGKSIIEVYDRFFNLLNDYLARSGVDLTVEHEIKSQKRREQRAQREMKYSQNDMDYVGGGNIVEAFVKTIVANLDEDFQRITPSMYARFWEINNPVSDWDLPTYAFSYATNRRLFVTDNKYIGLGPIRCQIGDEICVLYGCSVPTVLRTCDGKVSLIGEAYAHGLMDGQVIDLNEQGILKGKEWIIT